MHHKTALLLLALVFFSTCRAQSGLEVSGFYALGFQDGELSIFNEQISEHSSYAWQAAASYTYRFGSVPVKAMIGGGFKRVYFNGQAESGRFNGEADRPFVRLGSRYLFSDRWEAGFWLGLEGNRDVEVLRSATGDNFRSFLQLEAIYRVWKGLGISAGYYRALHPLQDHYVLYNPTNMVAVGINISFFE